MKTIIGLMVFLIIILLLLAISIPHPLTSKSDIEKAKHDATRAKMDPIESAIKNYKQNTGQFPEKLEDLLNCPTGLEHVWQGPYLQKRIQLYDSWDNPYIYEIKQNDSNSFVLISYGKDGKPGGKKYKADIYNDWN